VGAGENKVVRRKLLLALYKVYQTHPHTMLSPKEVMEASGVAHDDLLRNIFYLEEHGYVECLKGFGTVLFGAARLTARGVDIVEDEHTLNELFPSGEEAPVRTPDELSELFDRLETAARIAPLGQEEIDTLIDELDYVRKSLPRAKTPDRMKKIETVLDWISSSFDGNESVLQDIRRLAEIVREK
jgi:DNA-binding MarR family transcriptional regulator